jgi:hypothetical protein
MNMLRQVLVCSLLVPICGWARAQRVDPFFAPAVEAAAAREEPSRLAAEVGLEPATVLAPATEGARDGLAAIEEWNLAGNVPLRSGFARPLSRSLRLDFDTGEPAAVNEPMPGSAWRRQTDGALVWTTRVKVGNAHRVRLRLSDVVLPPEARLWVSSEDGEEAGPFGAELLGPDGSLWTPSVGGEVVTLEVRVPADAATQRLSFTVREVMETFQLDRRGAPLFATQAGEANESCLVDGRCIGSGTLAVIAAYRNAVAHLQYVDPPYAYMCSGGLLNDADTTTTVPYLLTAAHCISSQTVANTLEAFWDYFSSTCGGAGPPLGGLAKSNGATLLATGPSTDFTLLRLSSVPAGRTFLGWDGNASATPNGVDLHRLSHPLGYHQAYSRTENDTTPAGICTNRPATHYLYSTKDSGATFPGSSGAPVILASGHVVGQLRSICASNPSEPCLADSSDYFLDGRFSATFPSISQYINTTAPSGPCTEDATTACLLNSRFRAKLRFRNGFNNNPVDTDAFRKPVTGFANPAFETVFFYFNDINNIEVVLAMLDQGNTNGSGQPTIAVKIGTATPLRLELTITDTQTGAQRTYFIPFGAQTGVIDFTAFVK